MQWQSNDEMKNVQARSQFGTPEEAKSFPRGAKFFELCPIFLNYVQHIFQGKAKNFLGEA